MTHVYWSEEAHGFPINKVLMEVIVKKFKNSFAHKPHKDLGFQLSENKPKNGIFFIRKDETVIDGFNRPKPIQPSLGLMRTSYFLKY